MDYSWLYIGASVSALIVVGVAGVAGIARVANAKTKKDDEAQLQRLRDLQANPPHDTAPVETIAGPGWAINRDRRQYRDLIPEHRAPLKPKAPLRLVDTTPVVDDSDDLAIDILVAALATAAVVELASDNTPAPTYTPDVQPDTSSVPDYCPTPEPDQTYSAPACDPTPSYTPDSTPSYTSDPSPSFSSDPSSSW